MNERLCQEVVTVAEIAKMLRISVRSVKKYMLSTEMKMPVWKSGKTEIPYYKAKSLVIGYKARLDTITKSGRAWSIKEMAELLCLSTSTLYRACRELGYQYKGGVDKGHAPLLAFYARREEGWYKPKAKKAVVNG